STVLALAVAVAAGLPLFACVPTLNTPIEDIPKLKSLKEVMHNQATTADPQFAKAGGDSFTDADYAGFTDTSKRIGATSLKVKDVSKGPEFDALAQRLHEKAEALGTAAGAKDAAGSKTALVEMKATCKECHSKFR